MALFRPSGRCHGAAACAQRPGPPCPPPPPAPAHLTCEMQRMPRADTGADSTPGPLMAIARVPLTTSACRASSGPRPGRPTSSAGEPSVPPPMPLQVRQQRQRQGRASSPWAEKDAQVVHSSSAATGCCAEGKPRRPGANSPAQGLARVSLAKLQSKREARRGAREDQQMAATAVGCVQHRAASPALPMLA